MQHTGLPRRLAAMLYDALLVAALLFLATIPFIAARGGERRNPPVPDRDRVKLRARMQGRPCLGGRTQGTERDAKGVYHSPDRAEGRCW